jgi:hypothetical protein
MSLICSVPLSIDQLWKPQEFLQSHSIDLDKTLQDQMPHGQKLTGLHMVNSRILLNNKPMTSTTQEFKYHQFHSFRKTNTRRILARKILSRMFGDLPLRIPMSSHFQELEDRLHTHQTVSQMDGRRRMKPH